MRLMPFIHLNIDNIHLIDKALHPLQLKWHSFCLSLFIIIHYSFNKHMFLKIVLYYKTTFFLEIDLTIITEFALNLMLLDQIIVLIQ